VEAVHRLAPLPEVRELELGRIPVRSPRGTGGFVPTVPPVGVMKIVNCQSLLTITDFVPKAYETKVPVNGGIETFTKVFKVRSSSCVIDKLYAANR
jgi:hypothetical protein